MGLGVSVEVTSGGGFALGRVVLVKCERQLGVGIAHGVGSIDSSGGVGSDTSARAIVESADGTEKGGGLIA